MAYFYNPASFLSRYCLKIWPLPGIADLDAAGMQKGFDFRNGIGAIVNHRGNEGGIRASSGQDIQKVFRFSGPARGNDGNGNLGRNQAVSAISYPS